MEHASCHKIIANCQSYNETEVGTCDSCEENYDLQHNLCHKDIDNCTEYDEVTAGKCVNCKEKFTLHTAENSCLKKTENCKTHDTNANCTECDDNTFVLQNGKCHPKIDNCKDYKADKVGSCLKCEPD